jgi:hypothetical protein
MNTRFIAGSCDDASDDLGLGDTSNGRRLCAICRSKSLGLHVIRASHPDADTASARSGAAALPCRKPAMLVPATALSSRASRSIAPAIHLRLSMGTACCRSGVVHEHVEWRPEERQVRLFRNPRSSISPRTVWAGGADRASPAGHSSPATSAVRRHGRRLLRVPGAVASARPRSGRVRWRMPRAHGARQT